MTTILTRSKRQTNLPSNTGPASRLSLYNQYGALAYGVILRIVPQLQPAQELLVDLFASPELQTTSASKNTACIIIRLARAKAIAYRQKQPVPIAAPPAASTQADVIFDLMFCHNQSPDAIAEQLQIPRADVFNAVRAFFAHNSA